MTADESTRVITYLELAYPGVGLSVKQRELWQAHLSHRDFDAARAAVKLLVAKHPRLPSIAEVCGSIRAEERRSQTSTFPEDPDDGPPASKETALRRLDEYRAAIAGPSKWAEVRT